MCLKLLNMPHLYIIAGPNGAGKTSAALTLLPEFLSCFEYVNADSIAAGLSPFRPSEVAWQAGHLMLERIESLANQKQDFAFETTLSSRTFVNLLKKCKKNGYTISLLYLWLPSSSFAVERVRMRVKSGGHDIPEETIHRRYTRSLTNFFKVYTPLVDSWELFDNSKLSSQTIAKYINHSLTIYSKECWELIQNRVK